MPINEIETEKDTLVISADFPNQPPEKLFNYWVDSELMSQWWPPVAEIDPVLGGRFHLHWPDNNWTLRGTITQLVEARELGFTWHWDSSQQKEPTKGVVVQFEPAGNGTQVTITHGPYKLTEDEQKEREGHLGGWDYFISNLQEVVS
jgi:uncharacterized protein YndB with AHSA1/START domain